MVLNAISPSYGDWASLMLFSVVYYAYIGVSSSPGIMIHFGPFYIQLGDFKMPGCVCMRSFPQIIFV